MICLWNNWNIKHIEKHGVRPEDVNYILNHLHAPYPTAIGEGKFIARGQSESGRFLQVIFAYRSDKEVDLAELNPVDRLRFEEGDEVIYVIHARDLNAQEKRQWRRRNQR